MKNKKIFGILVLTLAAVLCQAQVEDADVQQVMKVCISAYAPDLDPHVSSYSTEAQILNGLYEGLFNYNPQTLEPEPALAESYEISADKKTWTFSIRKGAKFSDGKPITAGTIRDSWIRLLKTKDAPFASLLDCIRGAADFRSGMVTEDALGISARDERTLVLSLSEPTQHLPNMLCHSAFAAVGAKKAYSGAFRLEKKSKKEIVLAKNNFYWDAKNTLLPGIKFILSSEAEENTAKFNSGEADWISSDFNPKNVLVPSAIKFAAQFSTTYLFFKFDSKSVWNDSELRNALLLAAPWAELRKGQLIPATTLVIPIGDYPVFKGLDSTDPAKAAEVMKAARQRLNLGADEKIRLNLVLAESNFYDSLADTLRKAWEPLGVSLELKKLRTDEYTSKIAKTAGDMFVYSWIGDFADPVAFLELFRGDSTLNVTGWRNAEFDGLLKQASAKSDVERMKTLSEAEQLLLKEGVILPICHSMNANLIDTNSIGGWFPNAMDLHPLKSLYIRRRGSSVPFLVMK